MLRNSVFHWGTMIDQANLLNPTFSILENVGNDYLGAVLSGTVIDGVTVTPVASFTADFNAAVAKLKSKQANGVVFGVAGRHEHSLHDDAAAIPDERRQARSTTR